jgi:hypothetical protein
MVAWLDRLVGRKRAITPTTTAKAAPPAGDAMACFSIAELPALPEERQFSVWDKLSDDPGAQQIRAYWESKWETFCEPAEWGGPPARGDMLPFWSPEGEIDAALRDAWKSRAYRLALGVEVVAHMEPIVDEELLRVGFCANSHELAQLMCASILKENVGAIVAKAHPGMAQEDACDVLLACTPHATDDEIKCCVVATTKTAHVFLCAAKRG